MRMQHSLALKVVERHGHHAIADCLDSIVSIVFENTSLEKKWFSCIISTIVNLVVINTPPFK